MFQAKIPTVLSGCKGNKLGGFVIDYFNFNAGRSCSAPGLKKPGALAR